MLRVVARAVKVARYLATSPLFQAHSLCLSAAWVPVLTLPREASTEVGCLATVTATRGLEVELQICARAPTSAIELWLPVVAVEPADGSVALAALAV